MLRVGLVDCDSSHCVEFARRLNQAGVDREQFVDGARVEAVWCGESMMAPERIPGFRAELQQLEIPFVAEPSDLIGKVDVALVLSLCGAAHLERARPFLEAGLPTFVDKPFACSVADAETIAKLAAEHDALCFSSSGMRFSQDVLDFQSSPNWGDLHGVITYGPAKRAEKNPGLFHYGIHCVELLFELLGPDCESVSAISNEGAEVVTGRWADGRLGTVRGARTGSTAYGFTAFCEHGVASGPVSTRFAYRNLLRAIVRSIETGTSPVPLESSLAVVRFIAAALESERLGGVPVAIADLT
ncbi:gfo/Idh/MocA family oxidoreductase [bacterium]|nr:gfo/Idh/MocA family oxidoreductase [bacterium]